MVDCEMHFVALLGLGAWDVLNTSIVYLQFKAAELIDKEVICPFFSFRVSFHVDLQCIPWYVESLLAKSEKAIRKRKVDKGMV